MDKKYIDIEYAKLDTERFKRRKTQEVVLCECKTSSQLIGIFSEFKKQGHNVLGTRVSLKQAEVLKKTFPQIHYNKQARTVSLVEEEVEKYGEIAICTGGTGDIPVAEEASETALFYGGNVKKYYDIGIAGIHRLLDNINQIKEADVIIAIAGMEGALAAVIAGMVDKPVIAVPTSVGYGCSFNGISALLTMLNSCAEGVTVVNIDNGFNAAYSACQIIRLISKGKS